MRAKAIIIISLCFFVTVMISCFSIHYFYHSRIENFQVSNAKYENTVYRFSDSSHISYNQFSIVATCLLRDSLRYSEKVSALLNNLFVQHSYAAYDPGKEFEFTFIDSIKSINIFSLYNFNDSFPAKSNLNSFFEIGYSTDWGTSDSVNLVSNVSEVNQINRIFANKDRRFNILYLLLKIKEKPAFEEQQFVVNLNLFSGKLLTDTSKVVYIK